MLSGTSLVALLLIGIGMFILAFLAERYGKFTDKRDDTVALVLTRKPGEKIVIGESTIWCTHARGGRIKFHIDAPGHVQITRSELIERDREDAARTAGHPPADLQDADRAQ